MKVLIKKLYCPYCQRMVRGKEQTANNTSRILCSRCEKVLRLEDGGVWRGVRDNS